MRPTRLRRRASLAALSTALLAAVLVPLTGASAAACASWADDEGDATTGQSGLAPLADANLDIVAASFGTVGTDVVGVIKSAGLSGSSSDVGDEFRFEFVVAGVHILMYADRTAPAGETLDASAGFFNVDDDAAPTGQAEATYDTDAGTVTIRGPLTELAAAAGKPVAGQKVTELTAETSNLVLFQPVLDYDEAPTPLTHVLGTSCTLSAAPPKAGASAAPTTAPTTAPTATSGASATAAPSARPTATAGATAAPTASASPAASASATPTGPPPEPEPAVPVPAPGCLGFSDPAGDSDAAVGPAGTGDDPDLDLVSVTGRSTAAAVSGHLGVTELGSGPAFPAFSGHRFELELTVGGKVVVLSAEGTGEGTGTVDGTESDVLKVEAVFDEPSSQVVLTVDRAGLAKATGASVVDGAVVENLTARSFAVALVTESEADVAAPPDAAAGRYVVGDSTCFRPPLSVSSPSLVQTSDAAVVGVAVTTSDGRIGRNQTVTARVGTGRAVSATTDQQGMATLSVPVTQSARSTVVVVRSTGSAGEGELVTPIRVVVERSLLSVRATGTGAARKVTATLTDDDAPRRPLVGQRLTFAFSGRTVAVTTDRSGRAAVTVPPGTSIDTRFAGRSGFLTSALARTAVR